MVRLIMSLAASFDLNSDLSGGSGHLKVILKLRKNEDNMMLNHNSLKCDHSLRKK